MKKIILFLLFIPFCSFAQGSYFETVPNQAGAVEFNYEFSTFLKKKEIYSRLKEWLDKDFLVEKGSLLADDPETGVLVCNTMDYLVMERNSWSIYAIYMRYTLALECKDNVCTVKLFQVRYVEPEDIVSGSSGDKILHSYPASFVLFGDQYKVAFIKDAGLKIQAQTLKRVNELFQDIDVMVK